MVTWSNPLTNYITTENGPWTITSSGQKIYYAQFSEHDVCIHDIARHLAYTNRWCGALRHYYSTAQHSVLMAKYAFDCRYSTLPPNIRKRVEDDKESEGIVRKAFAKALLFHDAEEYITGDFPAPLKEFFPLFTEYADYVRNVIYTVYNVLPGYYDSVKEWDSRILFDEAEWGLYGGRKSLFESGDPIIPTLGVYIESWTPDEAEKRFKEMYLRLT